MELRHREILRKMRVELVKDLHSFEEILDHLFAESVVSENQRFTILASQTPTQKARLLLDTIVKCGPTAFEHLCQSMKITNQTFLLECLKKLDNENRPNFSKTIQDSTTSFSSVMQPDEPSNEQTNQTLSSHISPYKVSSNPRGYILIINVANFSKNSNLKRRVGSQQDVTALNSLFTDLGYSVEVLNDPDATTLLSKLATFVKNPIHKLLDAGGLVLLSHGINNNIYAADGQLIDLDNIIDYFSNEKNPGLAGKPKLILLQACRGEAIDCGYLVADSKDSPVMMETAQQMYVHKKQSSWNSLPYMSDCVIAYSTLPGFVSWRSEVNGSWFIQIVVDVFRRLSNTLHVVDLLAEVNRIIIDQSQEQIYKQISQPATTLTRPFFLSTANTGSK